MNNLSLVNRFALISLNGIRVSQNSFISRMRNRCFIAAKLLDFIFDGIMVEANNNYHFADVSGCRCSGTDRVIYDMLKNKISKDCTIAGWMKVINTFPQKKCNQIAELIIDGLINNCLLDNIPSLLECDLNYQTSEVKIRQYRSSYGLYHSEIDYIKAELLDNGVISDEVISLIWLLKQNGDLKYIFSLEELEKVQEVLNNIYRENSFGHNLLRASIGYETTRGWKTFLKIKKNFSKTQLGSGIVFKIPALQKDESIFIETNKMFSNAQERLADVKNRLETNGHICEVKSEGEVPLVEIDNILYELIPDAVRVSLLNVHGVRLRRFLV